MALRLYALGLGFILLLETPPPPPDPGTAWWDLGADGKLTGPPSMWGSFYGRADSVVRNPRGEEPTAKHSSRLESADPNLTMFLRPSEGAKDGGGAT